MRQRTPRSSNTRKAHISTSVIAASVIASPVLKLPSPAFHPAVYLTACAAEAAIVQVSSTLVWSYLRASLSSTPVSRAAATQVAARGGESREALLAKQLRHGAAGRRTQAGGAGQKPRRARG